MDATGRPVSAEEIKNPEIFIFPNPFRNAIHVDVGETIVGEEGVLLYSSNGEEVSLNKRVSRADSMITLHIANLPPGTYILVVATPDGSIVRKVMKID